ncbi:hypothetical protein Ancab_029547 [Ancistrocladus abbreviatus]
MDTGGYEDNEQRTKCRNESNDEVAGDGNVGLAAENALEKQRRLEGFSSPSVEASLMNEHHIDVDYVATEFQILSPVVMGLSKERDFEKRNKDTLGLQNNGSSIAAGLEPNSSEEQMSSSSSKLVNKLEGISKKG